MRTLQADLIIISNIIKTARTDVADKVDSQMGASPFPDFISLWFIML